MLPPLAWLQAFEAAARLMSFTAAGDELCVSQSAISQRIRLLEDRLGEPLFVRHASGLDLTDAGLAWLPCVQAGFQRLREGTAEVFGEPNNVPLTIRATPLVQRYWLAPLLAGWLSQEGIVSPVRIVTAIQAQDFEASGVDLEIRYGNGQWPGLRAHALGIDELIPVCTPLLAQRLDHDPTGLAHHTLIHVAGFDTGWPAWLTGAKVRGVLETSRRLGCDHQAMALDLARHGAGIALTHTRWLDQLAPELVAPFSVRVRAQQGFWLTRMAGRAPAPMVDRLWGYLEAGCDGRAL
ncbi:LysR family transcriptional regulator [Larsenimonas rhizosphaerae]|uniref:LysR family transcriptional regulator n=1 Tax=Larsenimonas rhizosphaerae TaxID=2944682 RepID=A0AA42CSK7_9GAMM|nr:LysR family transcriptional regulator [Larsenimonas rhizosphaerae]MCX2522652.1 LysR family transcriptional regulator [Larsenimonas rhizosphaerae]